jgi:hypothetical protein
LYVSDQFTEIISADQLPVDHVQSQSLLVFLALPNDIFKAELKAMAITRLLVL